MAQWNVDRSPLKHSIAVLGADDVRASDAALLSAMLVRDAFTEPVAPEKRREILFAVCEALASRADAYTASVIERFEQIMPQLFGLNAVGQDQAVAAFGVWRRPPTFIL
jgi:hypothetical protein